MKIVINKHSIIYRYFKEFKNDQEKPKTLQKVFDFLNPNRSTNEHPGFLIGFLIGMIFFNLSLFIIPNNIDLLSLYYLIPLTLINVFLLLCLFMMFLNPFIYNEINSDYYDHKEFLKKNEIYKRYLNNNHFFIKIVNLLFKTINDFFYFLYKYIKDDLKNQIINYFFLLFLLYFMGYNLLTYLIYVDYIYMNKENYYIFNFFLGSMYVITIAIMNDIGIIFSNHFREGNYIERIKKYYLNDSKLIKINQIIFILISIILVFFYKITYKIIKNKSSFYLKFLFMLVVLTMYNYFFQYVFFILFLLMMYSYSEIYSWFLDYNVIDKQKDKAINIIFKISLLSITIYNIFLIINNFSKFKILFILYGKISIFLFIACLIIYLILKFIAKNLNVEIIKYEDNLAKFILEKMD